MPKFPAGKIPKGKRKQHAALHVKGVKHEHGGKVHEGNRKRKKKKR
jgi:hypothetical protein